MMLYVVVVVLEDSSHRPTFTEGQSKDHHSCDTSRPLSYRLAHLALNRLWLEWCLNDA